MMRPIRVVAPFLLISALFQFVAANAAPPTVGAASSPYTLQIRHFDPNGSGQVTDAQWLNQYFSDDADHCAMKWLKKLEGFKSDSSVRETVHEFHSSFKTPLAVSMDVFETLGPKKQKLLQKITITVTSQNLAETIFTYDRSEDDPKLNRRQYCGIADEHLLVSDVTRAIEKLDENLGEQKRIQDQKKLIGAVLQIQKKPKSANEDQTRIYGQDDKTLAAPDAPEVKSVKASAAGQLH